MKGYFSQLAYRTGLSFEPRGARSARNVAADAPTAAMHEGRAKVEPLHTKEIALVTPSLGTPPNVAECGSESTDSLAPTGAISSTKNESLSLGRLASINEANSQPAELRNAKPEAVQAQSSATELPTQIFFEESHIRFTDSESKTAKPREQATEKQFDASEHEVVLFSDEVSPGAKKSAPPELFERVEKGESPVAAGEFGRRELLQNRQTRGREAALQEKFQPTNAGEQSAPVLDERMEEEVIVRNYLKEVRAWVSATPAMDGRDVEQNNWSEVQQGNRTKFALEQEENLASFPRRDDTREPEVQDLNLSIGSISIVVEEPRKDVVAPPPAPRKAEISPTRTGSESTSLSRYYLRSW